MRHPPIKTGSFALGEESFESNSHRTLVLFLMSISLCTSCCGSAASFRVLSTTACSSAKSSQASEGWHGRKFPFDENASCRARTRVVHRNAGLRAFEHVLKAHF